MKKIKFLFYLILAFCLGELALGYALGQQPDRLAAKPKTPVANSAKKISYQLATWKTKHIHDAAKIEQTLKDLKRIGCEVVQQQHGDHVDLRYRCVAWKTMTLQTDQQVNEWRTWLTKNGLETVTLNPPVGSKLSTVRYRLTDWQTTHLHDPKTAKSVLDMLRLLGCEVQESQHNGHIDARFRCGQWTTIGVPTCRSAHVWQNWLNQNGFETQHSH